MDQTLRIVSVGLPVTIVTTLAFINTDSFRYPFPSFQIVCVILFSGAFLINSKNINLTVLNLFSNKGSKSILV